MRSLLRTAFGKFIDKTCELGADEDEKSFQGRFRPKAKQRPTKKES